MPTSLKSNELSQWTHGDPDLMGKLLFNLFSFLKEATNKGKDNAEYKKVMQNIANFISLLGDQRLHIPQPGKAAIDASALLGAYLRLGITLNDKPIVELSDEQIEAVHTFVRPLIPENFTPKQFFDSLDGSPSQKHKTILKLLIFKDIPPQQQKEMFKAKYAEKVNNLLDSILSLVDFMRTPFSILPEEEKAAIGAAKKLGKQAQTSGIDLQWTSMRKAIEQSLQDIILLKKGKAEEAQKFLKDIKPAINQCQQCFGIANARHEAQKEFAAEARKHQEVLSETFEALGFPEGNQEKINHYISEFRKSLMEKDPENAAALQAMPLTQLIKVYGTQWQAALDKIKKELSASREELQKTNELLSQRTTTLEESNSHLQTLQQEYEQLKLDADKASHKLVEQGLELARLEKVESKSKETIEQQKKEIELASITLQQHSASLEHLKQELQIVQRDNEELKRSLISAQNHEKAIHELKKQLELLQQENELLQQQLELEKQTSKSSSKEVIPEINPLQYQLDALQREYESLLKRVENEKQLPEPASEVPPDVIHLQVQLETLRKENVQLKELLLKAQQPILVANSSNQQVELPANNIKPELFIALGGLRLNKADTSKIKQKIINCNDQKGLSEIATEIRRLEKINEFIEKINKGILERAGFFSSDPHKKIEAIETSFQQLSIEDKNKLAGLSDEEINDQLSQEKGKESDIGKFLKAIHHKRGFIPIRSATSFTFFKSEISHLKLDLEAIKAPEQVL
ncbi:hypothetical protein OQJ19_13385 [Fluoribacter gormanii]|uniref:hypothetical protein n=1 Tax=Fluoribacter gormanii TaxID=464 RepID=UPI002242E6DD|nr:hypothetical protein [Fluoribacter gormanii]MCW8471630.1 hypothetical protein [Fluoribacter gormanii]